MTSLALPFLFNNLISWPSSLVSSESTRCNARDAIVLVIFYPTHSFSCPASSARRNFTSLPPHSLRNPAFAQRAFLGLPQRSRLMPNLVICISQDYERCYRTLSGQISVTRKKSRLELIPIIPQ
jgi:hypothetical protein